MIDPFSLDVPLRGYESEWAIAAQESDNGAIITTRFRARETHASAEFFKSQVSGFKFASQNQ